MRAVSVKEMREAEAMLTSISEGELMERAGRALGVAIGIQFPEMASAIAYIGKGHNAGDALIALRVLKEEFGWEIGVRAAYPMDEWAELTRDQWGALVLEGVMECPLKESDFIDTPLLIDGLLGIGGKGAMRDPLKGLAEEMNFLRNESGAVVVAVDVPSGIDADSGEITEGAVIADRTFMIGAAKNGLLNSHAANACGSLALVKVDGLAPAGKGMELISPQTFTFGKRPRDFDFHKGKAGRVAILAGSPEFTGAALLATLGAIRGGAGLVTLHAPTAACDAIRSRLPLEAMLKPCDDPRGILLEKCDSIVIGPGLGEMEEDFSKGVLELIAKVQVPMVIDADGLNLLAKHTLKLDSRHLLTPHPGEFSKLAPQLAGLPREEAAVKFVAGSEMVLLLKGARTIIASEGQPLRINATGTPAMSNGGQGDLLSGLLGSLLGGGMSMMDAASLGAWLCGHAAELSEAENGQPATATQTASFIGRALGNWRRGER